MLEAKAPKNTIRNVRCRSADAAVPVEMGLSPSTTASSISSSEMSAQALVPSRSWLHPRMVGETRPPRLVRSGSVAGPNLRGREWCLHDHARPGRCPFRQVDLCGAADGAPAPRRSPMWRPCRSGTTRICRPGWPAIVNGGRPSGAPSRRVWTCPASCGRWRAPSSLDSLGPWVALNGEDGTVDSATLCRALTERNGDSVVVSEEVGLGVHPSSAAGRQFRDALGTINQDVAEVADQVLLIVAGRALPLHRAS